jgi:GT2 family glycosyltransferase
MNLGYVCTNYNNAAYTVEAVRSLAADAAHEYHIVVVDNASAPADLETLQRLACEHPNVDLVLNGSNVGYFGGLNVGLKRLRETHPALEFMVVGNNDLVFPAGFGDSVARLRPVLLAHAVTCPDIVTADGQHQNPHVIRGISRLRKLVYRAYFANYYLALAIRRLARLTASTTARSDVQRHAMGGNIYAGHGACYILGPVFFQHFPGLPARTFLMGEEMFLARQLQEAGLAPYYEPSIKVLHRYHATVGKIPSRRMWELSREAYRIYRPDL